MAARNSRAVARHRLEAAHGWQTESGTQGGDQTRVKKSTGDISGHHHHFHRVGAQFAIGESAEKSLSEAADACIYWAARAAIW